MMLDLIAILLLLVTYGSLALTMRHANTTTAAHAHPQSASPCHPL
jgi:hypothetical protein